MQGIAQLSPGDRAELFREASARLGLGNELIVEKDFWVCWTLMRLYAMPKRPPLLFKGGTSLSKCFQLIQRFSEDIDLALDRAALGFGGERDPIRLEGRKERQRAVDSLTERAKQYIGDEFLPMLREDFSKHLLEPADLKLDADEPSTILFGYPRIQQARGQSVAYISPLVRLELGARGDHHPVREMTIRSYAAEALPDQFAVPTCDVLALAPERTLVEKALIFHVACHKGRVRPRTSRHAYDLLMMCRAGVTTDVTHELFKTVATHYAVFFEEMCVKDAPSAGVRMVPEGEPRRRLESDYRAMGEMFFRTPPPFEDIMTGLHQVQDVLNGLARR